MNRDKDRQTPHAVTVHDVDGAAFGASNQQMRLHGGTRGIREENRRAGSYILSRGLECRLIEWSEIVGDR
jgi:hypothetical protein